MSKVKLTRMQHFVALLILVLGMPLSLPLALLVWLTYWLHRAADAAYEMSGAPFLALRHAWLVRCERKMSTTPEARP